MLESMHKGTRHVGKVPQRALARQSLHDRLTRLETDLNEAIKADVTRRRRVSAMKSTRSNKPSSKSRRVEPMNVASLIATPSELIDSASSKCAVVLMTRIRLARNLSGRSFPGWAERSERAEVLAACRAALVATSSLKRSLNVTIDELGPLERQILVNVTSSAAN